jgi:hypothetical protein
MKIDRSDKTRRQREPTNIVREVLCGNYDPKIIPEIENKLREAARIQAAKRASMTMATDRHDTTHDQRPRPRRSKATEAEAARVEALKRAQIAKFSTRLRPEIAKALVDAVYSVFPPPPKKKAPVPRKDN